MHCLRDLTRGGLASALIEIAEAARLQIQIEETAIPMLEDVQGACEILGFDPLYVANEGRFISFVPAQEAERALQQMRCPSTGDASPHHRNGIRRQSGACNHAKPDRSNPRRRHAQRRAAPTDLLKNATDSTDFTDLYIFYIRVNLCNPWLLLLFGVRLKRRRV